MPLLPDGAEKEIPQIVWMVPGKDYINYLHSSFMKSHQYPRQIKNAHHSTHLDDEMFELRQVMAQ